MEQAGMMQDNLKSWFPLLSLFLFLLYKFLVLVVYTLVVGCVTAAVYELEVGPWWTVYLPATTVMGCWVVRNVVKVGRWLGLCEGLGKVWSYALLLSPLERVWVVVLVGVLHRIMVRSCDGNGKILTLPLLYL